MKKRKKIIISIFSSIMGIILLIVFILYGPISYFRELLITSAMTTMTHQYLATWFYSDETIDAVLKKHNIVEVFEESNPDLITIKNYDKNITKFESETEEEILKKDSNSDLYKVISIKGSGYSGYLVVIYDPTKIKVATASTMLESGETLDKIAKDNNALIAINGTGYIDPFWSGNGSTPLGSVIQNGILTYVGTNPDVGGGIFGFTKEGKLILSKKNNEEMLKKGIVEGLEYGPFLIVNGKKSRVIGNGGSGIAPRTAIGQRQDGIVLFLVIDGRQIHSFGANMDDLVEIMLKYKAYNAVNLDGGASSALIINNKIINSPSGKSENGLRKIPTALIVTK